MGTSIAFLISAIVILALLLMTHLFLLSRVFADTEKLSHRLAAVFFPPTVLFLSWTNGRQKISLLWVCLLLVYILVRFLAG